MKIVSNAFTAKMRETLRTWVPRMTINGVEIEGDIQTGMTINKGSCGTEAFSVGAVFVPYITASIKDCNTLVQDQELFLEMGLKLDDGTIEYVPVGYFTATKANKDKFIMAIEGYGRLMSKAGGLYVSDLTWPATIDNVLAEISEKIGVPVITQSVDTSGTIEVPMVGLLYREALQYLAGVVGGFCTEDSSGNIVIAKYELNESVPVDTDFCYAFPTKNDVEYEVSGLEVIVSADSTDEEGNVTEGEKYTEGALVNVTSSNPYMNAALFEQCKNNVVGFKYMPATVNFLGDIRLEPWDYLIVTDDEDVMNVPCVNITHTWDGGLVTVVTAPGETTSETESSFGGPITTIVERTYQELMTAKQIIASKVSAEEADLKYATITSLNATDAKITSLSGEFASFRNGEFQTLKSAQAEFESTTTENLNAVNGRIDTVSGELADYKTVVAGKIEAVTGSIQDLETKTLKTADLEAEVAKLGYATAEELEATNANVTNLASKQANFETATTDNFNAVNASIDDIEANYVKTTELEAESADIRKLFANYATVAQLNATNGNIETLKSTVAEINSAYMDEAEVEELVVGKGYLTEAQVDALVVGKGYFTEAQVDDLVVGKGYITTAQTNALLSNYVKTSTLTADYIKASEIASTYATIANLNALNTTVSTLSAKAITTDNLSAKVATLGYLKAEELESEVATFGYLKATAASTTYATIANLNSTNATIANLGATYATIDLANVKDGSIDSAMIGNGVVGTAQIADGSITDAKIVGLTANKITAGTLDAGTIEVINLNAANITVGTINGQQIAAGAIDTTKLTNSLNSTITSASTNASQALTDAANAQGAADEAQAIAEKSYQKITSKGEQLIVNGNGMMGDDTNFSGWVFDGEVANNSPGSFTYTTQSKRATLITDEYFPLSTNNEYTLQFDMKSANGLATVYSMITFYDVDKKEIKANNHMYSPGSTTTLAQDLKSGDTVIYLTDASGWSTSISYGFYLSIWNYTNSQGYTYPAETYTRNRVTLPKTSSNTLDSSYIDYDANTITLTTAYSGNTIPAGTSVSQGRDGGNYKYNPLSNKKITTDWVTYSGKYSGVDYSGTNVSSKFPPGTAYARLGFLWNYNQAADQIWMTNVTVSDTTLVSNAQATADGKNTAFYQTSAPSTSDRKTNDIWFDTEDGNKMYYWNGSAWVAQQFSTSAIATNAITAEKIVSGAITAAKIASNTITATQIASGAITSDEIAANAVIAGKIATNAVTAGTIAADAITTEKIASGAVVADSIASSAVTTDKIVAGAITTAKLNSEAVTADKILAGTITSAQLDVAEIFANTANVGTLVATETFSNAISTHSLVVSANNTAGSALSQANAVNSVITNWCYDNDTTYIDGGSIYTGTVNAAQIAAGAITADKISSGEVTISKLSDSLVRSIANMPKKIDTYVRSFTASQWEGYATSTSAVGWSTGTSYDNSHISVGDTAYVLGVCSDKSGSNTVNVTLYGTVTSVSTANVTMKSLYYTMSGEAGAYALANSTNSVIANWCYNNDTTYIDGGNIYTGTVTAEKISASSLSAISANLGTVTAGVLQSQEFSDSDYENGHNNSIAGTVKSGIKIDLTNSAYYTPHIIIKDNYIEMRGYMTVGRRADGDVGLYSSSIGQQNLVSGSGALSVGSFNVASGGFSYAGGYSTTASNRASHAEGESTTASGESSHAQGKNNIASGNYSHAEGYITEASGIGAHVEGFQTIASSNYQHVQGKNNIEDASNTYVHIVGKGISSSYRSNAHTLDWYGNAWYAGDVIAGGTQATDGTVTGGVSLKKSAPRYIEGTGTTAGTWLGTDASITEYFDGLTVLYKVGIKGASTTTLNINSLGAIQVMRNASSAVTTHYGVGSVVLLTYTTDDGTGYWKIADYDANSYAYVRQYLTTTNANYPLLSKYEAGIAETDSYVTKYTRYSNSFYINPSAGTLTAPTFVGALTGNAETATKLATARTLTIGDAGKSFNGSANVSWTSTEMGYRHEWDAVVQGLKWSRLCHVTVGAATVGASYILNIAATRSNVVYNDTFLIKTHHSCNGKIIKLSGHNYSNGYQVRILVNSTGDSYVELYDNCQSIASGTAQTVKCRLIPIFAGTVTRYTSFTDGTTVATNYSIKQTMTMDSNDIQANVTGSLNGNASTASVATKLGSSTVGGTNEPIYLNAGTPTTCTKPKSGAWFGGVCTVGSDGVTDYGKYLDLHNSNTSTNDYDTRIQCDSTSKNTIYLPAVTGQAVVHTNDTAIGSSSKPVYVAASGAVTVCADTLAVSITGNAATATKATNDGNGKEISRVYGSLIPMGTAIPSNADLNTTDYIKVGNYSCTSNATSKTLTNCPIAGTAFMMQVYGPLSSTLDNESTSTYVYRIRKIIKYNTGEEFIQYVASSSTAGTFTYGSWRKVLHQPTYGTAIGDSTTPVYINSSGVPTACSTFATSGHTHSNMYNGDGTGYVNITLSSSQYYFKPGTATNVTTPAFYVNCGGTNYRWNYIYSINALNTSSDLRFKTDISKDLNKYVNMMDIIEPITFVRTNSPEDKRHAGYGAQDVEKALAIVGLGNDDFAGLTKDWDEEKQDYTYGLTYEEFIPILHARQNRDRRELAGRLSTMESELRYVHQKLNAALDKIAAQEKEIEQ